jgi:hypothetical protein
VLTAAAPKRYSARRGGCVLGAPVPAHPKTSRVGRLGRCAAKPKNCPRDARRIDDEGFPVRLFIDAPVGLPGPSRAIGATGPRRNFSPTRRSYLWRRSVVPVRKTARPMLRVRARTGTVELDMVGPNRLRSLAHNNRQQGSQSHRRRPQTARNGLPAGSRCFERPISPSNAEPDRPADELTMNRTYFPVPSALTASHDQAPIQTNRTYFADPHGQAPIQTNRTYFAKTPAAHPADPLSRLGPLWPKVHTDEPDIPTHCRFITPCNCIHSPRNDRWTVVDVRPLQTNET